MSSEDEGVDEFNRYNKGGELKVDDDFGIDSDEEEEEEEEDEEDNKPPQPTFNKMPNPVNQFKGAQQPQAKVSLNKLGSQEPKKEGIKQVQNQPFDGAVDVSDESEFDSGDDEEGDKMPSQATNDKVTVQKSAVNGANMQARGNKGNNMMHDENSDEEDDEEEDEEDGSPQVRIPGAYNAEEYSNLHVTDEIQEMFQYISRFKPHNIDLDSKIRPFIPDYIPAVGEVDAFIKPPRPDGKPEMTGLIILDEPALNHIDPHVLEVQYIQEKKIVNAEPVAIRSIESAEKNPKSITGWIQKIGELRISNAAPTVQYSKQMPDIEALMQEWHPEVQEGLQRVNFPGPDIELSPDDYAKVMCSLLDIPVHKTPNNKGVIEALHVMFTLYNEFSQNQHFQQQQQQQHQQQNNGLSPEQEDYFRVDHG